MKNRLKKIIIIILFLFSVECLFEINIEGNIFCEVLIQKENEARIYFLNKPLNLNESLLYVKGRLYIPLEDFLLSIGGEISENKKEYIISYKNSDFKILKEDDEMLKHRLYFSDDEKTYISIYDLTQLLHLAVVFDYENKTVCLYNREMPVVSEEINTSNMKEAYLRLEDFSAQINNEDNCTLEKFRVIIDYLYSKGQCFYIAWIPLYTNPPLNIVNDLTYDFNLYNADFIYTLDYAVNHCGNIVLHGLTHQENDTISGKGCEFGKDTPFTEKEIDLRMKRAKEIAEEFGYDSSIFEFPHYASTPQQLKIAEKNFKIIYQQSFYRKCMGKIDKVRRFNKTVYYVPATLGYIESKEELPKFFKKMKELPDDQINSLFIHPYIDFDSVTCYTSDDGTRVFEYDENGIFGQLVRKANELNYSFSTIKLN